MWLNEGNTGSVDDYLESIRGPKGDKGDRGPQGLRGPAGADASRDEVVFISDKPNGSDGSWKAFTQKLSTTRPSWVTSVSGSSVFLGSGVFEIVAQAQNSPVSNNSSAPGGIKIFARNGNYWAAASGAGKQNPENNGASMFVNTTGLSNPRFYVGCHPTNDNVVINTVVRKLV